MIGVGLDTVEISRFRLALQRQPNLVSKLFTPAEREYATSAIDPTQRLAVRFAAKEATMKALGVGLGAIGWHDAEVVRSESGQPSLFISGRAALLSETQGVTGWKLSLSHNSLVAEAIVIAL